MVTLSRPATPATFVRSSVPAYVPGPVCRTSLVEESSWAVLAGSIWPGRRPTLAPSGRRATSTCIHVPAAVTPGTLTQRSLSTRSAWTVMSAPPPVYRAVLVPTPCGASASVVMVSAGPDVSVALKLDVPSFTAAAPSAAAAAGSAAALAEGPVEAVGAGAVPASPPEVQPATPNVTTASRPSPVAARRRSSMCPPGLVPPVGPGGVGPNVPGSPDRQTGHPAPRDQALSSPASSFGGSVTSAAGGAVTFTGVPNPEYVVVIVPAVGARPVMSTFIEVSRPSPSTVAVNGTVVAVAPSALRLSLLRLGAFVTSRTPA